MENDRVKLISAFADLLSERPFDSLNPRMITERADLPASTFPYFFRDTYELADAFLSDEAKTVAESGIEPESGGEAFLLSVSFALRYPSAAKNLAASSAAGIYKKYVAALATKYFSEVVLRKVCDGGPTEHHRDTVRFLRAAAVGLASKELLSADDVPEAAKRFADVFDKASDGE